MSRFLSSYQCAKCRHELFTILVHRRGLLLRLSGFAPRRKAIPSRVVPDCVKEILGDAEQAISEKDVFAAFYHLRTMLEHGLKARLRIPIEDQIRGDDLIEKNFATLPLKWREVVPPPKSEYSMLSANLHARKGSADDFKTLRDAICDHFDMLALFDKQNPVPAVITPALATLKAEPET